MENTLMQRLFVSMIGLCIWSHSYTGNFKGDGPDQSRLSGQFDRTPTQFTTGRMQQLLQYKRLYDALNVGDFQKAKELINNRININVKEPRTGKGLLHRFAEMDNLPVVKFLVEQGANIDSRDKVEAMYITDPNVMGATGNTPLHLAAKNHHIDIVEYLVENGADMAARDSYNYTPLKLAQETPDGDNRAETIEYLNMMEDIAAQIDQMDQ